MSATPFVKMHGLGNDFVVIDARHAAFPLDERRARAIADRRTGIGCDQLILIEKPQNGAADIFMRIHNADGGEVEACGNGTRCIASLVMAENGKDRLVVETNAGLLQAQAANGGRVTIDFGKARLDWREIPLAAAQDTLHVDLALGPLADPVCTNIGNPHATFFVDDVMSIDLETLGPALEHHKIFPERANIGIAQIQSPTRMRFRVWERGVGITRACGTGACAAQVAASRRGLTGRKAQVELDGGVLEIEWRADGHVMMTGPVATSFTGSFDLAALG
ncbi:MAG: diaminopimelate epimerase [Alphaproteobacteria bacterium]|nr:diaminopimelate epimerase [Alphaproteobacteria bacterium]